MNNTTTKEILLLLLRYAVGNADAECAERLKVLAHGDVDWDALIRMATKQGVTLMAHDGYMVAGLDADMSCSLNARENRKTKLTWKGLEIPLTTKYHRQQDVIKTLSHYYAKNGIRMMVIKGYGVSLAYPVPEHRWASDIDIYCFDEHDKSNKLIEKQDVKVDYSEHKHTTFILNKETIENHHSFLNVHAHKSSAQIERILHEILQREGTREADGLLVPSPNFNVLYLLRHAAENFAALSANLRQLLDWALYVRKYHDEIDWQWFMSTIDKVGMRQYLDMVIAISVRYLGFAPELFPEYQISDKLLERSLNDIIKPEFLEEHPSNIFSEVIYKLRRWKANTWKHDMVYRESLLTSFMTQMWSHILKPSTIVYGMKNN